MSSTFFPRSSGKRGEKVPRQKLKWRVELAHHLPHPWSAIHAGHCRCYTDILPCRHYGSAHILQLSFPLTNIVWTGTPRSYLLIRMVEARAKTYGEPCYIHSTGFNVVMWELTRGSLLKITCIYYRMIQCNKDCWEPPCLVSETIMSHG